MIWIEIILLFEEKRLVARDNCYIAYCLMKMMHIFVNRMQ